MKFKIDIDFTSSAESLLNKLYYDNYLFDSGINKRCDSKDILKDHVELFDINIFKNLDIHKYSENDHEKIRLFKIFISELLKTYYGIQPVENLKNELNTQTEKFDSKEINLFSLISNIKTERKRENRKKLGLKYKEFSSKLLQKLQLIIENRNQTSKNLEFKNYSDQTCTLNQIKIEQAENLCKEFLNDTEYIYKDLLGWQLKNKLDIQIKDATYEDSLFLFNSFELKDYFKQTSLLKLSTRFLYDIGISLGASISFDMDNRTTKNCKAKSFPVQIPDKIYVSIYRIKTIEDYESILGELGKSLFFSSINIEQPFENKRLIDPTVLETFKILFQDFVFEQKWLQRFLRIDTDKNFIEFLYLKKLVYLRSLCVNVLLFRTVNENNNIYDSLQQISEIYINNMFFKPNENIILFDLALGDINPYTSFRSWQYESYLKEFLTDRFDEQWWREIQAGNRLIKWWKRCSDLTPRSLEEEIGIKALNNLKIISNFEKVF
jgi:hypothetical protein